MSGRQLATVPNPRTSAESAAPRPAWLTEPCPPWCNENHREQNYYGDRHHFAAVESIDLSLYDVERTRGGSEPGSLDLSVIQHYRAAEPDIDLVVPVGESANSRRVTGETSLTLTVAEARQLRDRLTALLVLVGAEAVELTAPRTAGSR